MLHANLCQTFLAHLGTNLENFYSQHLSSAALISYKSVLQFLKSRGVLVGGGVPREGDRGRREAEEGANGCWDHVISLSQPVSKHQEGGTEVWVISAVILNPWLLVKLCKVKCNNAKTLNTNREWKFILINTVFCWLKIDSSVPVFPFDRLWCQFDYIWFDQFSLCNYLHCNRQLYTIY